MRDWVSVISLALLPIAALTLILPSDMSPGIPLVLIAVLLGWHLLPIGGLADVITGGFGRIRSGAFGDSTGSTPEIRNARELFTWGLMLLAVLLAVRQESTWALVMGVGWRSSSGVSVNRGFLGGGWTDAAIPLAAATGIPVMLVTYSWSSTAGHLKSCCRRPSPPSALPTSWPLATPMRSGAAGSSCSPPAWWSSIVLLSLTGSSLAVPLIGLVALIPGIPVAFADRPGDPQAITGRLETLAVALTPGVAATLLLPGGGGELILAGWLAALVVWRFFTLGAAPRIRAAQPAPARPCGGRRRDGARAAGGGPPR